MTFARMLNLCDRPTLPSTVKTSPPLIGYSKKLATSIQWSADLQFYEILRHILINPLDPDWMQNLSEAFCETGLSATLEDSAARCIPATKAFKLLEETYAEEGLSAELCLFYAEQLWLRGHIHEAKAVNLKVKTLKGFNDFSAR